MQIMNQDLYQNHLGKLFKKAKRTDQKFQTTLRMDILPEATGHP